MILVITMDATSHSTIVNPFTVSHDRNRPLSKNSGHCLETHTGSHLEDEDTATTANTVISDSTIVPFFSTEPGPFRQIQATVWKMMQDPVWKMKIQLRHLIWSGIQ